MSNTGGREQNLLNVCVCEKERTREREREIVCVCVCVRERGAQEEHLEYVCDCGSVSLRV